MSSRNFERFQFIGLGFSLFLILAWCIVVYLVSPLRDPNFVPMGANAGTLIPWLSWMGENDWLLTAKILAFALSTNVAFIFAQQIRYQVNNWLVRFIATVGLWLTLFFGSYLMFFVYLLSEWLAE